MITIIDYGSGNIGAIRNIYKILNIECNVADTPQKILSAQKMILPGVGSFDETMRVLNSSGIKEALDCQVLEKKKPILGICVGMQILANTSEEGSAIGLGYIDGIVNKISSKIFSQKPHLPHLGWNSIDNVKEHGLFKGIDTHYGFYFLHSYHFCCDEKHVLTTTNYGRKFVSSVISDNVMGVQFHPEKSHSNGVRLFKNFALL